MTKYAQQQHVNTCCPTALVNALKWANHKISYKKDIKKMMHLCNFELGDDGTDYWAMTLAIGKTKKLKLEEIVYAPKISDFNRELRKNRILIFVFSYPYSENTHCALCVEETPRYYKVVNMHKGGKAERLMTKKKMSTILRRPSSMFWSVSAK